MRQLQTCHIDPIWAGDRRLKIQFPPLNMYTISLCIVLVLSYRWLLMSYATTVPRIVRLPQCKWSNHGGLKKSISNKLQGATQCKRYAEFVEWHISILQQTYWISEGRKRLRVYTCSYLLWWPNDTTTSVSNNSINHLNVNANSHLEQTLDGVVTQPYTVSLEMKRQQRRQASTFVSF